MTTRCAALITWTEQVEVFDVRKLHEKEQKANTHDIL